MVSYMFDRLGTCVTGWHKGETRWYKCETCRYKCATGLYPCMIGWYFVRVCLGLVHVCDSLLQAGEKFVHVCEISVQLGERLMQVCDNSVHIVFFLGLHPIHPRKWQKPPESFSKSPSKKKFTMFFAPQMKFSFLTLWETLRFLPVTATRRSFLSVGKWALNREG